MELIAVQLNDIDEVIQIIVADVDWATENLGGRWVQFVRGTPNKNYPGYGDVWDEVAQDFIRKEVKVPE